MFDSTIALGICRCRSFQR